MKYVNLNIPGMGKYYGELISVESCMPSITSFNSNLSFNHIVIKLKNCVRFDKEDLERYKHMITKEHFLDLELYVNGSFEIEYVHETD